MISIFKKSNPVIEKVFESSGSPRKVLIVPLDYAKKTHTALFCNGDGQRLKAPFSVHNTPEGISFLLDIVEKICRKHTLKPEHVIFAGEDGGSFSFNFIHALAAQGEKVIGVNAQDAARERKEMAASTDKIDLLGIVSLVLKRQGRTLKAEHHESCILRQLTRQRHSLVRSRSACKHRMHCLVDQLFPGFLDEKKSGILPFGQAGLWLMSRKFSAGQLRRRSNKTLLNKLAESGLRKPNESVEKLKTLARSVLPPPGEIVESLQVSLEMEVNGFHSLEANIRAMGTRIARHLAAGPGAFLTTIRGIGITLAAELYAEIGAPARIRSFEKVSSYAGLAPRVKQTGGPDGETRTGHRHRRCNNRLKNSIMRAGLSVGLHGPEELMRDYNRRENNGQDARAGIAHKVLAITLALLRDQTAYIPREIIDRADRNEAQAYYQNMWTSFLIKWRNAGAIRHAFDAQAPLEKWRRMIEELYEIKLPTQSPQHRSQAE